MGSLPEDPIDCCVGMIGFISRVSRIKEDTAIGIMYTGVFAVGDIVPADNLAYLLKYDSTQGRFNGTVGSKKSAADKPEDDVLIVNGHETKQSVRDYETEFWLHDIYVGNSKDNLPAFAYGRYRHCDWREPECRGDFCL